MAEFGVASWGVQTAPTFYRQTSGGNARGGSPQNGVLSNSAAGGGQRSQDVASGAYGGDNGPMEKRIGTLEVDMRDVRDRLARVEVKLDNVVLTVKDLPSKDFVEKTVSWVSYKLLAGLVLTTVIAPYIPKLLTKAGLGP